MIDVIIIIIITIIIIIIIIIIFIYLLLLLYLFIYFFIKFSTLFKLLKVRNEVGNRTEEERRRISRCIFISFVFLGWIMQCKLRMS